VSARQRPGLAKARRPSLVAALHTARVRAADAMWRELFDAADSISEGSARAEIAGAVWYGTTSLILVLPSSARATEEERVFLAAVAERDLHVRLRALRAAQREASMRAPAPLGVFHSEIHVQPDPRGVRIDVDVQAPLIEAPSVAGPTRR